MKGLGFSGHAVKKDVKQGRAYIEASAAQKNPKALKYMIKNTRDRNKVQEYKNYLDEYYETEENSKSLKFLHDGC